MPQTSSQLGSVHLVGLPKSGTTLLSKVFRQACSDLGVTHLPVHDQLYRAGIHPTHDEMQELRQMFLPRGYCYGAFRHAFPFLAAATEMPTIWIRRDPKDVLVSRYFSQAYSHPPPGGEHGAAFAKAREKLLASDVESNVLDELPKQARLTKLFLDTIPTTNLHVFWYEDIIYKKREWIEQMMAICGWQLTPEQLDAITASVDVMPTSEDPKAFIRQVHPGNHQKHLSPPTCARIDAYYAAHVPEWTND